MGAEEYRKKLKERAKRNREAFRGMYKDELKALMGLSTEEIDKITPGTTDMEIYSRLISVVKEASADNIDQAELKKSIIELGDIGVKIAKKIPHLAKILI
jgi:hypothetical protein